MDAFSSDHKVFLITRRRKMQMKMTGAKILMECLLEQGVDTILVAACERSKEQPLTTKERGEIMSIVRDRMRGVSFSKLPMPLRILSIFLIPRHDRTQPIKTVAVDFDGTFGVRRKFNDFSGQDIAPFACLSPYTRTGSAKGDIF